MIISKTPLRISLFGGGTDFPEYFKKRKSILIGGTINKYIYVSFTEFFSKLFKENIRIFYRNREFVSNNNQIKHKVLRNVLINNNIKKNLEIHIVSNLPSNTGLGSSSSFSVGLLNCINKFKKKKFNKNKLALQAIRLERDILKENVGFQDQIFASFGGFSKISILDKNKILVKNFKNNKYIKKIENNLFLVFTGIKRRADTIEKKKIRRINKNLKFLHEINNIAKQANINLIKELNPNFIGKLLHKTWQLKKKLQNQVSNTKIDKLYDKGLKSGATGGKLLGAGSGGFILFYVPKTNQPVFKKNFSKMIIDFKFTKQGSKILEIK